MAYAVMAYIVMAYMIMAYIVMAYVLDLGLHREGLPNGYMGCSVTIGNLV